MESLVAMTTEFWQSVSGPAEQRLLELMSYGLVGSMLVSTVITHFIGVPYGRYSSSTYGFPVAAHLAWLVQETPAFLVPLFFVLCSGGARLHEGPNRILLALFLIHYAYRSFIFPFLIRGGKPTPAFVFLLAFVFCVYNGYLQSRHLSNYAEFPAYWITDPRFIIGIAMWLSGFLINIHSDHILRNLRKPGETGYKIPRGGMFEYVTGANYFGETLEWFGFALAACTVETAAFAISTLLILGRRAQQHHNWYLKKFEDYPRSRKILIPFLY